MGMLPCEEWKAPRRTELVLLLRPGSAVDFQLTMRNALDRRFRLLHAIVVIPLALWGLWRLNHFLYAVSEAVDRTLRMGP